MTASRPSRVTLFVPCLVDLFFPRIGIAAVAVLERLGLTVDYPPGQTCCGQPAFNMGFQREARAMARRYLDLFAGSEAVVTPSGSCASMLRIFYPQLFAAEPDMVERALRLASVTYEFSEFLVNVLAVEDVGSSFPGRVAYHDSCHLLRTLGVDEAPRRLIRRVRGAELVELEDGRECCGFGGAFSAKLPGISTAMLHDKIRRLQDQRPDLLVACDAGCLMQLAGGLRRQGSSLRAWHLAELLAQGT
ncbi:MAG: (Fe-S)-binding protein [Acidobacteria bacterium]|nr:(Fe-S)-binding protein [Acidobacteriota bacterium]